MRCGVHADGALGTPHFSQGVAIHATCRIGALQDESARTESFAKLSARQDLIRCARAAIEPRFDGLHAQSVDDASVWSRDDDRCGITDVRRRPRVALESVESGDCCLVQGGRIDLDGSTDPVYDIRPNHDTTPPNRHANDPASLRHVFARTYR